MSERHGDQGMAGGIEVLQQLSRAADGRPRAPERIVHLGLGNFTRAHQAWYTEHAPDADRWGIAAFTGRSGGGLVEGLRAQDDVYTLVTSAPQGDTCEVISSISSAHVGTDVQGLRERFADPSVVIATSTVTEAGYMRDHNGDLDVKDSRVAADISNLREDPDSVDLATIPLKVVAGLMSRRAADAGYITVLPCDNLPGNGAAFSRVVRQAAESVDLSLLGWMDGHVHWATSMVDRITPATTDAESGTVAKLTGRRDEQPVRTEPFAEWVIAGDFPAGRPAWEQAGATITGDVTPYEQRKLWMLNGAHTTLAYTGMLFGYDNVAHAVSDPMLRGWLDEWWDMASPCLSVPSDAYRRKLVERFSNPRIDHHLEQIGSDGSQKLPVRIVPAARQALAKGRSAVPAARTIAAWILFVRRFADSKLHDVQDERVRSLVQNDDETAIHNTLAYLDGDLAADAGFREQVGAQLAQVREAAASHGSGI